MSEKQRHWLGIFQGTVLIVGCVTVVVLEAWFLR